MQVDHWLNKRPFDRPDKAASKKLGRVIIIGAGPAGLAAAQHLKVNILTAIKGCVPHPDALHGRPW